MDKFAVEYESFLIDDEPEYYVFGFNDTCSMNLIAEVASTCDTFAIALDLNPCLTLLSMFFES